MHSKLVRAIQIIPAYIDPSIMDYDGYIIALKQRMVHDLLRDFPSMIYNNISFEICKADSFELIHLVEEFKLLDGRYMYNGEFVSRGFLAEKLANRDYKIVMTAYVGEDD